MNVCLIKAAGFAPQGNFKGAPQLSQTVERFIAEIHTKCWEWVTDNRFERLPDQNCWIWLPGVTKGGVQLNQQDKELGRMQAEIHTKCWEQVTDNIFQYLPDQNCWIWLPGVTEGGATAV